MLVTIAVWLLIAGLRDGRALEVGAGTVLGMTGALGVIALARMIVVGEREARRR